MNNIILCWQYIFFCPCVLRNDRICNVACVWLMLCATGKWPSLAAKVHSIDCFECALNDPIYLDVDGKLEIQFASVTDLFSVHAIP